LKTADGAAAPSLRLLFTPIQKSLKQNIVFARGSRHIFRLGAPNKLARRCGRMNRWRRSFVQNWRSGGTGGPRRNDRKQRYTSENETVHIELFFVMRLAV
jgi:hypothetical protein